MRKPDGQIVCNCCGKALRQKGDLIMEDYLHLKKEWGYFSEKDGKVQEAHICEACYDDWVWTFVIAPGEQEKLEY